MIKGAAAIRDAFTNPHGSPSWQLGDVNKNILVASVVTGVVFVFASLGYEATYTVDFIATIPRPN